MSPHAPTALYLCAALSLALAGYGCAPAATVDNPPADAAADGGPSDSGTQDAGLPPDAEAEPDMRVEIDAGGSPDAGTVLPGAIPRCPNVALGAPPAALGVDGFYTQHADVGGLPLIAGPGVPEAAFRVAAYVLENLLAERPCARLGLQAAGVRFGIMGPDDVTTDMPEYSDFYEAFPGTDWDTRGRGFGATWTRPLTTGAVENLLQSPQDPWFGENIFLHEVAHSFFEFGVEAQRDGPEQRARLQTLYAEAMSAGLWADTYAATNANEYWAEAVQSYASNNLSAEPPNGIHNHVDTREELFAYDPEMAAFIEARLGARTWPAYCDLEGAGPAWTPPSVPAVDCDLRETIAADNGCDEANLRSERSDEAVPLTVVNQSQAALTLHWVDFAGQRQPFGALGPRSQLSLQTFETHGWVVTDADGTCRNGFVAADQATRFIVR
jgi:hypothetical protein